MIMQPTALGRRVAEYRIQADELYAAYIPATFLRRILYIRIIPA